MSQDITKVRLIGPAQITVGGTDLGHTDEKGITLEVKGQFVEAFAGKYGKAASVQKWLNGQTVDVTFNLIESNMDALVKALPGATKVTNGGFSKLTFGKMGGTLLAAEVLLMVPFQSANTPGFNIKANRVVPVGDFSLVFSGDTYNVYACKFSVQIDEASGADGSYLLTFGDDTIVTDPAAPTFTVVPVDGAPAVDVDTSVIWTASKNLDPGTVNVNSVHLIEDPLGTAVERPCAVTLANAGAATTITAVPATPLTAATDYVAVLESSIKGQNGVAITAKITDFQTA